MCTSVMVQLHVNICSTAAETAAEVHQLKAALPSVQDPVVFSGTVRDNLDPFGSNEGDSPLWAALRQT